jgi:hypothetical protein
MVEHIGTGALDLLLYETDGHVLKPYATQIYTSFLGDEQCVREIEGKEIFITFKEKKYGNVGIKGEYSYWADMSDECDNLVIVIDERIFSFTKHDASILEEHDML